MNIITSHSSDELRRRAEALLAATPASTGMVPLDDVRKVLHELQVHQVELELQNEELRRTQQALEESRTRYMRLYHDAPVGYVVLDTMGRVSETNASFARMVQRDRAQILGRPFGDFIHADDRPIFFARSKAFIKNPAEKSIELRLNTREATDCHVSIQANRPVHPDEELTLNHHDLLLTVTDITDRVVAEQALAESEAFARSTVDALSANIAILDAAGHIIAVNRAWQEFAQENGGHTETTGEGANYLTLCQSVHGLEADEARRFGAGILKVINGELDFYTQEYACHSPTVQRWFVGRVTRFPGRGSRRTVVAHENITERKHLEAENLLLLRQVNQLEKEDSLNRMAGAIAHHFNNLLFVVLGNIELALEMDGDDPMFRQCLRYAQDGTNRMAEISGKMLTYLGLTVKDRTRIDLSAACSQSLPLLQAMYPETVHLHALFPEQGPNIVAHAPQIQELLHILVENARESCHDQQCHIHLTISTAAAEEIASSHRFPLIWTPQHAHYACLQIRDNGSGIAQEHLERIFDPFFSDKFLGRGMGLSLVQGILRAHEGCVTVVSTTGQGTTISVYLPLADQTTADPALTDTTA